MHENNDLIFAEEAPRPTGSMFMPWKILVVDDDVEIHRVTQLVVAPFVFKERPIEILTAMSGLEARTILGMHPDIAVVLLDVVMETDDAGLRLVRFIREQYVNRKTRIILRTGQPGYAPEVKVLLDYDINDYRQKAELTAERLITALAVSLRSYMDIDTAERATVEGHLAREALLAKSTFLANISHELRTPLNAIIGNIEFLKLTPLTPKQVDIADSAATAARILIELIGDLLDLSKIEADRFEIDSEPTEIVLIVEEARAVMALAAHQKNLWLRTSVAPDVPQIVATDPGRLRQVLLNLLSNAIKFTPDGGVDLSVRCEARKNGVVLTRFEVRDTGIGFEQAKAAAIFEPFIQADNSMSRRYGGTGLGLSICRRIVELLGGTIGCSSEPGRGSIFWFDIPLLSVNESPISSASQTDPSHMPPSS